MTCKLSIILSKGSLRVLKKLLKIDATVNKRTGCHKSKAHTDGYSAFQSQDSDYDRYARYNGIDIPCPFSLDNDKTDDNNNYNWIDTNPNSVPLVDRLGTLLRPQTAAPGSTSQTSSSPICSPRGVSKAAKSAVNRPRQVCELFYLLKFIFCFIISTSVSAELFH